jgi:hypothetical protein
MPGSVVAVSASAVLPLSLSRAFEHSRAWAIAENSYALGESQRRTLAGTSRKSWRLAKRLTSTELAALRAFFYQQKGPQIPFYFYDGTETSSAWAWDPTGAATTGRYTVTFANDQWAQSVSFPRHETEIQLVEVA